MMIQLVAATLAHFLDQFRPATSYPIWEFYQNDFQDLSVEIDLDSIHGQNHNKFMFAAAQT